MRKIMLGVLGAIAITIMGQGTTFAAEDEMTAVTTPQTLSSTTTTLRTQLSTGPSTSALPRDTNLSNQNHSGDQ
jgi:hypothetical protein